jgi:hypothetical protein
LARPYQHAEKPNGDKLFTINEGKMAKIILVADDCRSRAAFLETCSLPDFYMEDFSIQGFSVRQYKEACELLRREGYAVLDKKFSTDIIVDRFEEIPTISSLFKMNGIEAQLSDIADTLYQA